VFSASHDLHSLVRLIFLSEKNGLNPSYEEKIFNEEERQGRFYLVASRNGGNGSLTIHQDAKIYLAVIENGQEISHDLEPGRHAWLQVLRGEVDFQGETLKAGDGIAVSDEENISVKGLDSTEVMLFDLA